MNKFPFFICCAFFINACKANPRNINSAVTAVQTHVPVADTFAVADHFDSTALVHYLASHNVSVADAKKIQSFYRAHSFGYIWFSNDTLNDHARIFWKMHNDYILDFRDTSLVYHSVHNSLNEVMRSSQKLSAEKMLETELELTMHYFVYAKHAFAGKIEPGNMNWYISKKKFNEAATLDSFLITPDPGNYDPVNPFYKNEKGT